MWQVSQLVPFPPAPRRVSVYRLVTGIFPVHEQGPLPSEPPTSSFSVFQVLFRFSPFGYFGVRGLRTKGVPSLPSDPSRTRAG